jgi:hypothetical protein
MKDLDNCLVERVNQTEIETITGTSAGGTKNALFDLFEYLSDTERAAELMAPINAVHYFRNEHSHDEIRSGWEEALEELETDDGIGILELYRLTLDDVANSLNELESLLQQNRTQLD